MKQIYFALCMALALSFTACRDSEFDNPINGGENEKTDEIPITVFDDLAYFQNAIIPVDSIGEMICRSYGEVLYTNEPGHLYIGVKDLAEAENLFRGWIAPDVELSTTIPTTSGLTCPLTDINGKPQGTLYFTLGTERRIVAEVTASSDTQLKHFNKITFLLNDAWPLQSSVYQKYTEGDIISHTPVIQNNVGRISPLYVTDQTLRFVCVRQGGNGMKPVFCAITTGKYLSDGFDYPPASYFIRVSNYTPSLARAQEISSKLRSAWNYYVNAFDKAGCGKLSENLAVWTSTTHRGGFLDLIVYYDYIYLASGLTYGSAQDEKRNQYLLTIDWLDDDAISTELTPTAGSPGAVYSDHSEEYPNLFDGSFSNRWCSTVSQQTNGVWFVEFQTNAPVIPTAYKMTTVNNCQTDKGHTPKSWKFYGKANPDDEWTLLSEIADGKMADINCRTYTYPINKQELGYYMYYRMEISSVVSGDRLMFSELSLSIQNTIDIDRVITVTAGTQRGDGEDQCANLFNRSSDNYWYCPSQFKQNNLWFVEFETNKPGTPVSYNLYTSSLSANDYHRHPKDWKLYGKLTPNDEWTLIDGRTGQDLPHSFYTSKNYVISNPARYQYYRFEVSATNGASELILGGFEFVYND